MPVIRLRYALLAAAGIMLAIFLLWPRPVDAQCGTQASSCKNCHEVQAQDPVNSEGAWHIDHAFGDFCEFCHAGNVIATEADAAHEGMVYPLADAQASCASCHPTDYQDLAVTYAETLGVEITAPSAETPTAEDENAAPAAVETPTAQTSVQQPSAEMGGAIIDLNARYEDTVRARTPSSINVGNVILGALLIGLIGIFGVLIWHFEGLGERWAELRGARKPAVASPTPVAQGLASQALQALLPALEKASPATLASLARLLEEDPERGGQMIEALAHIDPRLVEVVRRLDDHDMELLIALVRELKKRGG